MSYYSKNPHYAPDDFSEDRERLERCEEHAARWFAELTKPQLARYNDRMAVASAYRGAPKWDRERAAALAEFEQTTGAARRVYQLALQDLMATGETGEISEATSYAFDEAKVAEAMLSRGVRRCRCTRSTVFASAPTANSRRSPIAASIGPRLTTPPMTAPRTHVARSGAAPPSAKQSWTF
jgi:hypothetical protein